jgi:predicted RNA binding protein YcfA (HicA-like mRNA interferase family)
MKAKRLLAILERKPLSYRVVRQSGSHRRMEAPGPKAAHLCLP